MYITDAVMLPADLVQVAQELDAPAQADLAPEVRAVVSQRQHKDVKIMSDVVSQKLVCFSDKKKR